jgi:hypothetical protein
MRIFSLSGVAFCALLIVAAAPVRAHVFELFEPEVEFGETSIESLNGVAFGSLSTGEDRNAHKLSLGFGVTDYWNTGFSFGMRNTKGDGFDAEGVEWENVFVLLPWEEEDQADSSPAVAVALFAGLGVSSDEDPAFETGPILGFRAGRF